MDNQPPLVPHAKSPAEEEKFTYAFNKFATSSSDNTRKVKRVLQIMNKEMKMKCEAIKKRRMATQ